MSSLGKTTGADVTANNQSQEKMRLVVNEHETLNGLTTTELLSTSKLATKINRLFHGVFHDYSGSRITIDPNPKMNQLQLEIVFEDHGTPTDDKIKNLISRMSEPKKPDGKERDRIDVRAQRIQGSKLQRAYDLSSDTKDILLPYFMPILYPVGGGYSQLRKVTLDDLKVKEIDNIGLITEVSVPTSQFMAQQSARIYLAVKGLDLTALVNLIYSNKVDGRPCEYSVAPIRPISGTQDWVVAITRLDKTELDKAAIEVGSANPAFSYITAY